jgi:hypothetical protein
MRTPFKTTGTKDGQTLDTQKLMRDNPVVSQGSQKTMFQSDINLSILNETSPFKLSDIHTDMTEEEHQLRKLFAVIEARRGAKASQPILPEYASGDSLLPLKNDDLRKMEGTCKISITTHAVTVTKVDYATADNLMRLKLDFEEDRQKGHYNLVRDLYISEAARMTINDAVSRVHREQAMAAFQRDEPFPQYEDYEWLEWGNDKFFEVIPPLLRLKQAVAVNPMINCFAQIR